MVFFNAECKMKDTGWAKCPDKIRAVKLKKSFAQRGLFFLKYAQLRKAMSNISNRACKNRVPNIDKAILSAHCHNDLGLAVANSLAAVQAGARQIECTINGIGERAGNAALEEIVMALRTRPDKLPYTNNVETKMIMELSRTLSEVTGFSCQPNKAIVGANAFAHESGIHQDGMLKNAQTYEIMTPESIGLDKSELVLGKHSGRHAFRKKLEALGYKLGENALEDAFVRFKDLADAQKKVSDEELVALVGHNAAHMAREGI